MKYVIWGAGQRGKKALSIFGKEKIIAFIDNNADLVGKKKCNVSINNLNYLKSLNERYIILITPLAYSDEIIDELNKCKIYNYLNFADHPFSIDLNDNVDSMEVIKNLPILNGEVGIYGITWFTLYLYDYFMSIGIKPLLFNDGKNNQYVLKLLSEEYNITNNLNQINETDYILAPECIKGMEQNKYINIEDFIEKAYPVNNPMIEKYKGIHKGKRCFIVATGPSLKISDLDNLYKNKDICISMNRIYNLFNRTNWRPNYYVIEDQKMIEDLAEEIVNLDIKDKFVSRSPQKYWENPNSKNSVSYRMVMQNCLTDQIGFSRNLERLIYNGYTVTYVCLQLAIYMGFSEIYLLGVDFNYSSDIYAESNHFEGYQNFYKDIRLNSVMPDRMERAYRKARKIADSLGVHIYNATRGGKLEVFERVNLDSIL